MEVSQEQLQEERFRLYDEDIREPLFVYLEDYFGKLRILEEKTIGKSRADIVVITEDSIVGIEIKSDVDSYARLKKQVRNYDIFCDSNYIAIGKSHAIHVAEHIPAWWGILVFEVVDGSIRVKEQRPAKTNQKIKRERQITLMWRPELQRILEKNHLPLYKQKSKKFVQQKLLERIEWASLKEQMCEELFERDYTLWNEELEAYRNQK